MLSSYTEVIAAISTPPGSGGIGIVRMSGEGCIEIASTIFEGKRNLCDVKSHTISYGVIKDNKTGEIIDEVLVSVMRAPNTYTKEDVVEINCHGGSLVTGRTLEACLNAGARIAEAGEFTKRAFLNGRIDLTQAEAVIDIINSKTDSARRSALCQLEGGLKNKVQKIREKILDMTASIEAAIDYPEHDIEEETYSSMLKGCNDALCDIDALLSTADEGKILREGIEAAILGKPNVGKSSLLNSLLNEDRAIVTDIPGTTRDALEEYVNIAGVPVKIVDTAGIRQASDAVEKIGVEKSKRYADTADIVIIVIDGSRDIDDEDIEILNIIKDKPSIALVNKSDIEQKADISVIYNYVEKENVFVVSVKEDIGMSALSDCIKRLFLNGNISTGDSVFVNNARQKNSLYKAKEAVQRAIDTINNSMPEDFISMDLQDALYALGEITGDTADDEIIDRIFTKFCLGK